MTSTVYEVNDVRLSTLVKKYGKDLGHIFIGERCDNCRITQQEFLRNYPDKLTTRYALCSKFIELSIPKPRIQKVTKSEFWQLLYNLFKDRRNLFISFKDTYEYFWENHKINRSTFKELFNEIYQEQKFDGKNALHVYGSPSGAYRDEDRLPMKTKSGYKEWSIWGMDDFDRNDSSYEIKKDGVRN